MKFRALQTEKVDGQVVSRIVEKTAAPLEVDQVLIRTHYSSLNYKDALAITGRGAIFKKWPLTAGIDVAGEIVESRCARYRPGDLVLINGCGLGETFDGGFAEFVQSSADWVLPLPSGLSPREAMELGTAGFTAGLALWRMKENHQHPRLGPLVVTGPSGGVGGWAISIAAHLGYEVRAYTSRPEHEKEILSLGATRVFDLKELLGSDQRALQSVQFGGGIDNLGGLALAQILAKTQQWGNVASIGLALSSEIQSSVMPFILRGVSLLGVSSTNCSQEVRHRIWQALADPWKPKNFSERSIEVIGLEDLVSRANDLLDRKLKGRNVVNITK